MLWQLKILCINELQNMHRYGLGGFCRPDFFFGRCCLDGGALDGDGPCFLRGGFFCLSLANGGGFSMVLAAENTSLVGDPAWKCPFSLIAKLI
jgi:hypothetical protein